MFSGNEILILLIALTVIALVVWGAYLLVRKAVQSGTERANRSTDG